mmetsp:Transcript_5503/g.13791  ORF Transcript_5503/g.13791 Transcript_5503/m.13791 type:complete len:307 (+) Transcript_5503:207-1127(+)
MTQGCHPRCCGRAGSLNRRQRSRTIGKIASTGTRILGTGRRAKGPWQLLLVLQLLPIIVWLTAMVVTEATSTATATPRPVAAVCSSWSVSANAKACGSRSSRFRMDFPIAAGHDTVAVEVLQPGCEKSYRIPPVRTGRVTVVPARGTASVEFVAPRGILLEGPTVDFCLRATVSGSSRDGSRTATEIPFPRPDNSAASALAAPTLVPTLVPSLAAPTLAAPSLAAPTLAAPTLTAHTTIPTIPTYYSYQTETNVSLKISVRCKNNRFRRCRETEGLGALYAVVESISLEAIPDPPGGIASEGLASL